MIDIEERLTASGEVMRRAAERGTIPAPPTRSAMVAWRRPLIGAAAAAVLVAGGVALVSRDGASDENVGPAAELPLPPGAADGAFGIELPLVAVDDGDGNPDTARLELGDIGRGVIVKTGAEAEAASSAMWADVAVVTEDGAVAAIPPAVATDRCVELDDGYPLCGDSSMLEFNVGLRGPDGVALFVGVPADAAIATFEAGSERYWQRPVDGIAAFPFTEAAAADATVRAIAADGAVLVEQSGRDSYRTPGEVAAMPRTTQLTGRTLPATYGADAPAGYEASSQYRLTQGVEGRPGFAGPLSIVAFYPDGDYGDGTISVVTVLPDDVAAVTERIKAVYPNYSIDEVAGTPGVVVVAGPAADAAAVGAVKASIRVQADDGSINTLTDDGTTAFDSSLPPAHLTFTPLGDALLGGPIGTITTGGAEYPIIAQGDDVGGVEYSVTTVAFDRWQTGSAHDVAWITDPTMWTEDSPLQTAAAGTTAVVLTFDDGSTVDATVIDGPAGASTAAVFVAPELLAGHTVAAVDVS